MFNLKVLVYSFVALILASCTNALAETLPANLDIICNTLLQQNPNFTQKDYQTYFDKTFVAKIPLA